MHTGLRGLTSASVGVKTEALVYRRPGISERKREEHNVADKVKKRDKLALWAYTPPGSSPHLPDADVTA